MNQKLHIIFVRLGLLQPAKVMYVGGSDVLPPPLPGPQEQQLLLRLAQGDHTARQCLIEHNLRLVVYIARRFENTGVNLEDLVSIGTIGLIKAVGTFRADKKIKLATYASRCIENEILMYIRKLTAQKSEISLDEPINTDWDGNELLLSDILGHRRRYRHAAHGGERGAAAAAGSAAAASAAGARYHGPALRLGAAARRRPRRRWPICWASPNRISPGWKSGSCCGCAARSPGSSAHS